MKKIFQKPKIVILLLSGLLALYLVNIRNKMDSPAPFFYSDAQIKLYQTDGFAKGFLEGVGCNWKGESLDPHYEFYPFDIPWARLNQGGCQLAYPIWFPLAMSGIYFATGINGIGYIPILLEFIIFVILGCMIYRKTGKLFPAIMGILLVFGSSVTHTSLQYSEITLSNFLLVICLYFYTRKDSKSFSFLLFLIGIFTAFILTIRPESIVLLFSIFLLEIYYKFKQTSDLENKKTFSIRLNPFLYIALGFIITIFSISFIHLIFFDHILGLRGLIVSQDISKFNLDRKISLILSYLRGNEGQVGIFPTLFCLPLIPCVVYFLKKKSWESTLLIGGFLSFVFILLFSPYNADGHFASLRFFESSWIVIVYGGLVGISSIEKKNLKFMLYILIFIQIFVGWNYIKKSNDFLISVSKNQSILNNSLKDSALPLVHTSLFTGYLTGGYYLKSPVFLAYSTDRLVRLLEIFEKNDILDFALLNYEGEIPENINYGGEKPPKIYSVVEIPREKLILGNRISLSGFNLKFYKIIKK